MSSGIGHGRPLASVPNPQVATGELVLEALSRCIPPQQIDEVLQRVHRQSVRVRKLPAPAVVWLMLTMGLRADLDLRALWRQVCGTLAALLGALEEESPPTKSALSQARSRLGPRPLRQLFLHSGRPIATARTRGARYKGMPLKAMDADDYKTPDTPDNAAAFGRHYTNRKGKRLPAGYPQLHLNRLIEVGTHICIEALIKPIHFNDHATAPALLAATRPGDLVMWDSGFYSFKLVKQAMDQGTFFLCPVASHIVLNPIERLGSGSYLARIYPTWKHRRGDREGILVRVLEYTIDDPAFVGHGQRHRLITNLLDAQMHPTLELIALYHERWEIELDNDEITTHQLNRPVELRSRTPRGVVQEVYALLASHNAVRWLMHEAAQSIDVDPRRLSFMHAVRVIRDTVPVMRNAPTRSLPRLYEAMIALIATGILPARDGRINPRVIKVIRPSNFPAKQPHHYDTLQPSKSFAQSIVLLN